MNNLSDIVTMVVEALCGLHLLTHENISYFVYGHEFGALLAFEICRRVQGEFPVKALFVSSMTCPQVGVFLCTSFLCMSACGGGTLKPITRWLRQLCFTLQRTIQGAFQILQKRHRRGCTVYFLPESTFACGYLTIRGPLSLPLLFSCRWYTSERKFRYCTKCLQAVRFCTGKTLR